MKILMPKTLLSRSRNVWKTSVLRQSSCPPTWLHGEEVFIPVPWGVLAARQWGDPSGHPWVGPCFPPGHKLLAIDLPGHGLSSHYPKGIMYHYLEFLVVITRVERYFGWGKFSLLGHSMGAGISSLYAGTFPEKIGALIMLDLTSPTFRRKEDVVGLTRKSIEDALAIEARKERPEKVLSSFEEALKKAMAGVNDLYGENGITEEAASIMMKRGLKEEGMEGFVYTRDLRHKAGSLYGIPTEFLVEWAKSISCPHLIVAAQLMEVMSGLNEDKLIMEIYKQNPKFEYAKVDGTHHVHMNDPEKVNPIIVAFIKELTIQDY